MSHSHVNYHGDVTVKKNGITRPDESDKFTSMLNDIDTTTQWLMDRTTHRPRIAIICGSGLGQLAEMVEDADVFNYKDIPNFPVTTVVGHKGRLLFGILNGKCCVCMQGRFHSYEGLPMYKQMIYLYRRGVGEVDFKKDLTFPVRVFAKMGIELMFATNACGSLNPAYNVGDLMIMRDHINLPGLAGLSPLVGLNDERFGARFVALSTAYNRKLKVMAKVVAKELGYNFIQEGVYMMQFGPCFETVAECRMARVMGADVMGMSTVPEVTVARQCGISCFGLSLVTNKCIIDENTDVVANHEEVLEIGRMRSKDTQTLIYSMVGAMDLEDFRTNNNNEEEI